MDLLEKIKEKFDNSEITSEEALQEIFSTYLITEEDLNKRSLSIKYIDDINYTYGQSDILNILMNSV